MPFDSPPFFTVLCPIEAIAYPLETEEYLTHLQPGTYYAVLELTTDTLSAGRLDEVPEVYLLYINEPSHWRRFLFTDDPDPCLLIPPRTN